MRNIVVEKANFLPTQEREIEIVERKGIGHPDTICDLCAEVASQKLSQFYLKKFGQVLHHNLDKGLLVAGRSRPKFGGGRILEPIKIIIAGRATDRVGKLKIPVSKIVEKGVKEKLKEILSPHKLIQKNFKIFVDFQPGAANLQEVFKREKESPIANDTSFGIATGPYTKTERATLAVANLLNSENFVKKYLFLGKDVKVMSLREKENLIVTFVVSYIDRYIKGAKDYFEKKEKIRKIVENFLKKNFSFKKIFVFHNTLDDPKATSEDQIYLTVSGLSAEAGDDGQVGRGNRVSGLITPCRSMSLEAAAGKNINHPGKLYQILAHLIAQEIARQNGVLECVVELLSQIGSPLDQPQVASVKLIAKDFKRAKEKTIEIVNKYLDNLSEIQLEIVQGKHPIC